MGGLPHRCFAGRRARRRGVEKIRLSARPFPVDRATEIARATGLSFPVATVLARRGLESPAEVRDFLAADESHDSFEFEGMDQIAGLVLDAIRSGRKITIYGDFDCDGVCATSILVGCIRDLGGQCDWFIPDRIADGYGLNPEAIRRLAERGSELVVTVDCGVTAVEEVALARSLGMEIVVTDHHQTGPELPNCPILHPLISGYPFEWLCGAAVAGKLASALRSMAGLEADGDEADLDLVALATVADVMPLVGENRQLVRRGLKVARRAQRVGMAALMADARVEPSRLSSGDFGFRLAPRINAAGRLFRADAGVELFLAESRERADEVARELGSANAERRRVEQKVESLAKAELRELGEIAPAVVVAGEGWHPGVVGIVASKLVKATGRPSVVISLEGEVGRGSARSVPGLDLHEVLGENSEYLESFGGHAAAAGLTIRTEKIGEFRVALSETVAERIGTEPPEPSVAFDAVAGGAELALDLAEELEGLEPFGNGNPAVKILVPGATIEGLQEMGEGKHCRFAICTGSHRAKGVAFGRNSLGLEDGERVDVVAELSLNHWNGSVEPQMKVVEVSPVEAAVELSGCDATEWWDRFEAGMDSRLSLPEPTEIDIEFSRVEGRLPGVMLAELISSGERLVIVTSDARRRWMALGGSALTRFLPDSDGNGGQAPATKAGVINGLWTGSPGSVRLDAADSHLLVTDFAALADQEPVDLSRFDRIAMLDPPFLGSALERISESALPVHLLAGRDEFVFTGQVAAHRLDLTAQLRDLFRLLRGEGDGAQMSGEALREALSRDGDSLRSPEESAILLRVLIETGLARSEGQGSARAAGVVSSKKTELTDSAVFVHFAELHKEHKRFLSQFDKPTPK